VEVEVEVPVVPVPVPVPVLVPVPVVPVPVEPTPDPEDEEVTGKLADGSELVLVPVAVPVEEEPELELEIVAPTENEPDVAKISLMFPMLTASMVKPSPGETIGASIVIIPSDGSTLLATANASLNCTLTNSNENVENEEESLESVVQVIFKVPPLVTPVGVLMVRAETKGATSTRRLVNLVNILNG